MLIEVKMVGVERQSEKRILATDQLDFKLAFEALESIYEGFI